MEMGLLPGTPVTVTRFAPLGDPLQLRLRGYALSIRRSDAIEIEIDAGFVSQT
jgi:Fe2+ transport system protein FeoA